MLPSPEQSLKGSIYQFDRIGAFSDDIRDGIKGNVFDSLDKGLAVSNADDSEEDRIKMNKLGSAIILTSQGVPFFQAGEEMLRSKPSATVEGGFDENSYCSPDSTNSLKSDNKANVMDTYEYYKGLIAFRKAHGALRMTTASDIQDSLTFMSGLDAIVVAYTIEGSQNNIIV